jgi:hypothetical protein
MLTKQSSRSKQPDLFKTIPAQPQWDKIPTAVRKELLQLLREMLFSPPAEQLLEQLRKGGRHE